MDATVIVYALSLTSIYALMAIGISILWSSIGMINMAHGATFAVSGYTALIISKASIPILTGLLGKTLALKIAIGVVTFTGGILGGMLSGIVIYFLAFQPLHDKSNFAVRGLIVTLAINLLTVQCLLQFFGPQSQALPKIFGFGRISILGVPIRYDQFGTIVLTAVLLVGLLTWLAKSRKGLELRAMMQNPEGAALSGIRIRPTGFSVILLTGALAGFAAVLLSQTIFVNPNAGAIPLIKGLTIALLGGLGSVRGAMLGALLIGSLEAFVGVTMPFLAKIYPFLPTLGPRYVLMSTFLFIIVFLVIRPRGIDGVLDKTRK